MKPLAFSRCQISALWWVILIFYIINTVFLLQAAAMYFSYRYPAGLLAFLTLNFCYSATSTYLEQNYVYIGAGYVLLSVPFAYGVAHMVASLIYHRQLAFHFVHVASKPQRSRKSCCESVDELTCGWHSVFTLKGKHFSTFVMTVETIEVALQTWQAYRNSKYIVNARVNQLYAVCIFINCWSTSLIHYIWDHRRGHTMMARFLTVLADVVLDFVWGVVLPSFLFWPYIKAYWDQTTIEDLIRVPETPDRELRQILVVSASNFLLNGFSFVSMAVAVHRICWLLHSSQITSTDVVPTRPGPTMIFRFISLPTAAAATVRDPEGNSKFTKMPTLRRVWAAYAMCMTLWGTGVLIVSIAASGAFWTPETTETLCVDRLHPWFTHRVSCVGRAINCTALGIQGNKSDITSVVRTISRYLLGNLAFTDCPRLDIPRAICDFSGIQTIVIRQSTLVEWNEDAAITDVAFPELQTVQLIDSQVHCKPAGITTHRFPSSFEWLRFRSTNVESFIYDVEDAWWSTHYFHCVQCGLRALPPSLDYMDGLVELELGSNQLTDLAISRLQHKPALRYLTVCGNPISTLPDGVWELLDHLLSLDIQATNI